ncbi:MAG: hypothetical protein RL411_953 [Bacteroidota bacterium]|jgi:hypothetical protein
MMDNNSNDMNAIEAFLIRYGIDIGFLVSGFFGALLLVSKNSAQKLSTTIASILAGTACANYLTPVVMSILPQGVQTNGKYAVAFVMGFMGLKGLELILEKWFNKNIKDVEKVAVMKPKSRRKKIKKG